MLSSPPAYLSLAEQSRVIRLLGTGELGDLSEFERDVHVLAYSHEFEDSFPEPPTTAAPPSTPRSPTRSAWPASPS